MCIDQSARPRLRNFYWGASLETPTHYQAEIIKHVVSFFMWKEGNLIPNLKNRYCVVGTQTSLILPELTATVSSTFFSGFWAEIILLLLTSSEFRFYGWRQHRSWNKLLEALNCRCRPCGPRRVAAAKLAPHYPRLLLFLGRNVDVLPLFEFIFLSLYLLVTVSPCTATHERSAGCLSATHESRHQYIKRTLAVRNNFLPKSRSR